MRAASISTPGAADVARSAAGAMGVCAAALGATSATAQTTTAQTTTAQTATAQTGADQPPSGTPAAADEVVVTGVRPLLGNKLPDNLQDTPQSITIVTSKLLQEQGATRLEDALKNVPGITLNAGEGAARGDTVNLRGFSAFNDFFLDGVRDAAVYTRDSFNLDAVEVVTGPSAVLFGRGSTGGAINQVSKAPVLAGFDTADLELGTSDVYRSTVDIDQPFGPHEAFRLNLMGESSEVAQRDDVRNRRFGVAPSLAFGIGEPTTLTLAYLHQQEDNVPDTGIPFVDGKPAAVRRENDYGLTSDRATADDDILTARLKHTFDPQLTIADTFRYAHYGFGNRINEPNFGFTPPAAGMPLNAILVGRDAPGSVGTQTNLDNQLDVTARFATGIVTHTLVAGFELSRQTSDLGRFANPFNTNNNFVPETPLLSPDPNEVAPSEPITSTQDTTAYAEGVYATDTIGITRYIDVIAGLRLDRFAASYNALTLTTGVLQHLDRTDKLASPRVALVVKPVANTSLYFSYGTSFDPSAEALTLTTKTADLGPVKAKTYEAGAKTNLMDGHLLLTGAVFQTEVDNAQTNDPENPTVTVLNGDQRVRGFELGANGHLTSRLEINAGYTYLDPKTVSAGTPAFVGEDIPNAAHNAVNLWLEYYLSDALEVGAGGNYLGSRYADSAETARVPSSVVWNAMASYRVTPHINLQLNAFNLFDKLYYGGVYYTSPSENHVIPGAGRSVKLTARVSF